MRTPDSHRHQGTARGFTLPAILVIAGALLILAVGALLITGIERGTARSFADRQRAELAARAGIEEIRGILSKDSANDDYIIQQAFLTDPTIAGRDKSPYLFLTRGKADASSITYRHVPLVSTIKSPEKTTLQPDPVESLVGTTELQRTEFTTLPYQDKVRAAWLPVEDDKGRIVARYAYWVEDLQGRLDPTLAGNQDGNGGTHVRAAWPFPAAGINPDPPSVAEPALNQIPLFAMDPAATDENQETLGKNLFKNRQILISPDSTLAAAGFSPPLTRLEHSEAVDPLNPEAYGRLGQLTDKAIRSAEQGLFPGIQTYQEQPLVPFAAGIDPSLAGQPKINLNKLLAIGGDAAVTEMAAFIKKALPKFENRKGGFPDDYLKTLAANAIDYADRDALSTLNSNEYRGIDSFPLLSEVVLQINYEGIGNFKDLKVLKFKLRLFAELHNPTTQPVAGAARLSYEVALPVDGIGSGVGGRPFDALEILSNPDRSTHDLELINGRYWTKTQIVALAPNQYLALAFAEVFYRIDIGRATDFFPNGTPFGLREDRGARGITLRWQNQDVDRISGIVRQEGLIPDNQGGGFKVNTSKVSGKAALPGHVYDDFWPSMHYNMGDSRITSYLRESPAAENAYPNNISPNRRNIRLSIYNGSSHAPTKPKVYSRVLPSEWPDGGHNSLVGFWTPGTSDSTLFSDPKFSFAYDPVMAYSAPQRISNQGRFFSVTELGRIFDPVMYAPVFSVQSETEALVQKGLMPDSKRAWPDVVKGQESPFYGGGNTLRIGRFEHPAFDSETERGNHAARLLDLFHCGIGRSVSQSEREGAVIAVEGHVNLNTAKREVLRSIVAGNFMSDPALAKQGGPDHVGSPTMAPHTSPLRLSAPTISSEGDRIADAIISGRPYTSPSEIAFLRGRDREGVFGNRKSYKDAENIEWTDSAAEEVFARVYESSTVRSRNFRVWVVAQAVTPTSAANGKFEVLAEVRRSFCIFANPGQRANDGTLDPGKFRITETYENDF